LRVSDRVWPDVAVKPTQRFLDDVRTAYGASLLPLDFAGDPGRATDAINEQVSKDTDGLVPKLFDQPLSPATTGVLTDAVVLKAQWQEPFVKQTDQQPFGRTNGEVPVTVMASTKPASYAAAGGWQAAQIPYQLGTLAAVALLPPSAAPPCSVPSVGVLSSLVRPTTRTTGVTLPLLRLEQGHDLLATLATMGLPLSGDYSGLAGSAIGAAVQKDVMTVDELGTVAAGATGVEVEASAALPPDHELSFDRPFLLLLEDTRTHSPLFLAAVGDPNAR
jgi:serpin B